MQPLVKTPSSRRTQPLVAVPQERKKAKKSVRRNGHKLRLSSSNNSHASSRLSGQRNNRTSSGKALHQHGIVQLLPYSTELLKGTTTWPAMQKANMHQTLAQLDNALCQPSSKPSGKVTTSKQTEAKKAARSLAEDNIDFSLDKPPSVLTVLSTLISNTGQELETAGREIGNRLAYCLSSPSRIMSTVASMFLYSCSMLLMASSLLGTFAVVLPVLGAATFPVWLGLLIAGGAVAFGATLGIYNASNGRSLLPDGTTHWFDLMFKMNYLSKMPLLSPAKS